MEKKRKMGHQMQQGGTSSRPRYSAPSVSPVSRPVQQQQQQQQIMPPANQGYQTPQHLIQRPNVHTPQTVPQTPQRNITGQKSGVVGPCYSCGQTGHLANRCTQRRSNQTPATPANNTQNRNTNTAPTPARQNYARAHVNHVALEQAQEAADAMLGTFLAHDN